ncbi:MAG TPA: diacylglycerol kinase family protein [Saprospiraceae bacterium]|nr:diacylglycerol kinase family protein [Saprospiraceae bacterium]HMP25556.1 diacylglycerol kinase family protein [Saprospiraceae bacterium]
MLNKRLKSFKYAFAGISDMIQNQPNIRIHLLAAACAIGIGIFFGLSPVEWCMLSLTIALMLAAEAFNTALEYLTDLVSPEYHPLAGKVKDAAAAGVLLAAIGAIAVGGWLFLPRIWAMIG